MNDQNAITLQWHGAAHYHIFYKNLRIVIDPLYTRLKGDIPHLDVTKDDVDRIDYLLLTHGHLDHSKDFPYLLSKHRSESYAPEEYINTLKRKKSCPVDVLNNSNCHNLDQIKGKPFKIADIEITPYQIGTEEIDFWFIRSMFIRPWRHGKPGAIPTGIKWLMHHLFCNCFAFHFRFPQDGKTMLYFGNLTANVEELSNIDHVNVLAIPYCPANSKWQQQSQYLINRFNHDVTLVHHFDNFMNPYTRAKYTDLGIYAKAIRQERPNANLYFSKFYKKIDFKEIVEAKKE